MFDLRGFRALSIAFGTGTGFAELELMTVLKAFEKFFGANPTVSSKIKKKARRSMEFVSHQIPLLNVSFEVWSEEAHSLEIKELPSTFWFQGIIICFRSFRGFSCSLNMNIKIDCLPCTNNGDPKYSSDLMAPETANRMHNCPCVTAEESSLTFSSRNCTDCWEGTTSHGLAKHNWRESMSTELKENNSYITLVKHTCISF